MNPFSKKEEKPKTIGELEAEAQEQLKVTQPHYHKDENGFLVQCYHRCGNGLNSIKETLKSIPFWVGVTVSYPLEHMLWERVPGFSHIAHWLGMH